MASPSPFFKVIFSTKHINLILKASRMPVDIYMEFSLLSWKITTPIVIEKKRILKNVDAQSF